MYPAKVKGEKRIGESRFPVSLSPEHRATHFCNDVKGTNIDRFKLAPVELTCTSHWNGFQVGNYICHPDKSS